MGDLAITDVVVTATPGYDVDTSPDGRIGKKCYATLTFGDGVKTYPANGIPMPGPAKFYMNFPVPYRWVDIRQPAVSALLYTYDDTPRTGAPYGTIRILDLATDAEFSGAPAATTLKVCVTGK